jgi:hypothetical protein
MLPSFFPYRGLTHVLKMEAKTMALRQMNYTRDFKSLAGFGLNPLAINICLISIQICIFELKLDDYPFC